MLTALTRGDEGVYSEEYRRQHRLGAASTVQKALQRLMERELIEFDARGTYRVPDVFLRAWIRRLA